MGVRGSPQLLAAKIISCGSETFLPRSAITFVVCTELLEMLERRFPNHRAKFAISPNGVEVPSPRAEDSETVNDTRKKLGIDKSKLVVLFVGRSSGEEYGFDMLMDAISIVRKKWRNVVLCAVGEALTKKQRALRLSLGLNESLFLTGPITHNEVIEIVRTADICIGPLRPTTTLPLKVLEYFSQGKPVVAGRGSVSMDLVTEGENCLLVDQSPSAIAEGLNDLLNNRVLAEKLVRNALIAVQSFTWETIVSKFEAQLQALTGEISR
jgi:glycosyltransferase involved in cell wall biosynthesis